MSDGPKTCPCCGGHAALRRESAFSLPTEAFSVTCRNCGITAYDISAELVVQKWNRRVHQTKVAAYD
jgi:hypothetical protein